jgi:hypothetical protein
MRTFLNEMATRAIIYKSSQSKGATVYDEHANEPIVMLDINTIINYEQASKMNNPKSQANMQNILMAIQHPDPARPLPPIYVRKSPNSQYQWQVVDGHHRYWAYKKAGIQKVPARIIAPENIQFKSKWTPEDQQQSP